MKVQFIVKRIFVISGMAWGQFVFSQTNTDLTDPYQPPQSVSNVTVRMLPGFHANSKNVLYGSGGQFVARSKNYDPNDPGPVVTDPPVAHIPSQGENYVYTRIYLAPVTSSNSYAPQVQSITYFDGLGRSKQNISIGSSPKGKDLVTPIVYDGFGRQNRDYLPIPQEGTQNGNIYSQNSSLVDFPVSNSANVYPVGEKIFTERKLEDSPLDRVFQQVQPGTDWQGHLVKFDYQANVWGDYVRKYETTTSIEDGAIKTSVRLLQYFQANQLYKNKVEDEDENISYEFKNGEGQTLLVRKMDGANPVDTYYVYNDYDQLAYVIPPLASASTVDDATVENLYYQYRYDGRNRLVEKKLPGKGWEYMVYDKQDRLVMTQDTKLNQEGQWLFTKYDQFGRVAYTGFTADSGTRQGLQTIFDGKVTNNVARTGNTPGFTVPGLTVYYDNETNKNYPNVITKLLSVNYYDTYPKDRPDLATLGFTQAFITDDAQSTNISTKSLPVASYLNNIETHAWTKTFSYYDDWGRAIATYSKNHLGGHTKTESTLDFSGVPQSIVTRHRRRNSDAADVIIRERFKYDHQNRLKEHYHQVDNRPEVLLADNTYD